MAIIDLDLGSSDQTIDQSNANDGDTLNILALGTQTLTIDGVDVGIQNIVSVTALAVPTFEVVNDGSLDYDAGLLNGNLLSTVNFVVNDTSSIRFDSGSISLLSGIISDVNLTFNGTEDGVFEYVPPSLGLLSSQTIDVDGMESLDQIVIDGRDNLGFSYDAGSQTGTLTSPGGFLIGHTVTFEITGMTQVQADMVFDDLADTGTDTWVIDDTFIMPVCLTAGTDVLTPLGRRKIEALRPGDLVLTCDHGAQPLRWIGARRLTRAEFEKDPRHLPIRIRAGALGHETPRADLLVSPQHRVLLSSPIAQRMFDSREVLVAAKKLLGMPGIEVVEDCEEITYMHLLFDEHEVIFAEEARVESLLTGPMAMKAMPPEQREEIASLFPEVLEEGFAPVAARLLPDGKRIRRLIERHLKNRKAVYAP